MVSPGFMGKLGKLHYVLSHYNAVPFFGFMQGHTAPTRNQLAEIERLIDTDAPAVASEFEARFAALVGDGQAVSFAAARMAFFALMKSLTIGAGDEIILPGATCAVMVNAVLRAGAKPVYSDIDPDTFGSSAQHIASCITSRTRMIVAQHSFGIPCDIRPIVELAHSAGIFLLEDCSITLGSKVNGITVGNFGDAALFSTDRTKPLNAMIGGLLYTSDDALLARVREIQVASDELPAWKQHALWKQMLFDRAFCTPARYGSVALRDLARRTLSSRRERPYLDQDFGVEPGTLYPYPARMPAFLAALGVLQVQRWNAVAEERKAVLRGLLEVTERNAVGAHIPKAYHDPRIDIVPLRLAWAQPAGETMRHRLSGLVDVPWTWFMLPIVGTNAPIESYGYLPGSCTISERTGPNMVNLPCNISPEFADQLINGFAALLSSIPS